MKKEKVETYSERAANDRKIARQFDLAYFEDVLQSMPAEIRDKKMLVIGPHSYSIKDILDEIRNETENAEMFRSFLKELRMTKNQAGKR